MAEPFACLGIIRENVQAKAIVLSQNLLSRAIYPAPVELLLGPLYTRNEGPMFTSNHAFLLVQKLKSAPRAITLGVKSEIEKIFSICP